MTDVAPTSTLAITMALLSRAVARSATFQGGVGASSTVEAERRVYFSETGFSDAHQSEERPLAVVSPVLETYGLIAGGESNVLRPSGTLFLYMAKDVPPSMQGDTWRDRRNRDLDSMNFHGGVLDDVAALSASEPSEGDPVIEQDGQALGELPITQLTLREWGFVSEGNRPSLGYWSLCIADVQWGDSA